MGAAAITSDSDDSTLIAQREASWLTPDSGLWVGSIDSEHIGMIEFRDGHFLASDSQGRALGSFSDVRRAKLAIEERWRDGPRRTLRSMLAWIPSAG